MGLIAWTDLKVTKSLNVSEFLDNRNMKLAGDKPGTDFCWRLSLLHGRNAVGSTKSLRKLEA
jgi:hypothetical protein